MCLAGTLIFCVDAVSAQSSTGQTGATSITGGQSPGQAGLTPNAPSAIPSAAQAGTSSLTTASPAANLQAAKPEPTVPALSASVNQYAGLRVEGIRYVGVEFAQTDRLQAELTQKIGQPLDPQKVHDTTRRLFATGRYRNIDLRVERNGDAVTLIFGGIPRYYVGRVQVNGIKEDRLASLVEYGTKLEPGTPFTNAMVTAATEAVKQVLAQNGYYEPRIAVITDRDDAGQQVNVTYTIAIGALAHVGNITITGKDPGITEAQFRKKGKLKRKAGVTRETTSNALSNLRAFYQKKDRLEATVSLQKSTYDTATNLLSYDFQVEQGPVVQVKVEGVRFSKSRLHLLVPVFEEGTVDNDLVNEGVHNMKDFLQQEGYFDAKVSVQQLTPGTGGQTVLYSVDRGDKHKVLAVNLQGNKYFSSDLLREGLRVQKADAYLRSGRFSQQLVTADENSIQAIYRSNGFNSAKVTSSISDMDNDPSGKPYKTAQIRVTFKIDEGIQQKFGTVNLDGVDPARLRDLQGMLQATSGQPFSLVTLSGDRDSVLGYYLSNGFDQAKIEVVQTPEAGDKAKTDIAFNVTEGKQVFIGRVLQSGLHYTRQKTVNDQIRVQAGAPLDQSALLETQRNLYNLALFNEVNAAVQNPAGDAEQKNVLLQLTEAKRWDVTYGVGFEAQTGTPGCGRYCTQQGTTAAQQGKAGVSPRVSIDISRINLRGTGDSITVHGTYGLLEKIAIVSFQVPHLLGNPKFSGQISGGYSNVQDITTFASSKLQGDFRVTHKATRKDTFIYDFQYRRVAVDPNSLAISSNLIPILSQPVRVGGPGITWFHDTRSPSPLDASKGSYTSVENFLASSKFGSQTDFNRTDLSNSTYYVFGKQKYVFARNTRLGFIKSFGTNPNLPTTGNLDNPPCGILYANINASCNSVPLPERLYAGGATSHRGFPINGAGPRDLQTGFPVGGSGAFINTFELRLPAQTLPYVGNAVSFVLFHDMGNVFQHASDIFPSIARFHQPNEKTCENLSGSIGTCDFRYFSHAIGVGARYHTAVGPLRVDLSYNLNPPKYPVFPTQGTNGTFVNGTTPTVGNGSHFNFFFSIGQSF